MQSSRHTPWVSVHPKCKADGNPRRVPATFKSTQDLRSLEDY